MSDISAIIEKVKKLLALSARSTSAAEAATAAAMANKIIDEYRLSECDLETKEEGHLEPIEEDSDYIYESGKVTTWKQELCSTLVDHYGCSYWNDCTWKTGRQYSRFRVVGRRSDIGIVRYMFAWLMTECQRLAQLEAYGHGKVFVNSYCLGFVRGIRDQLQVSRKQAEATATGAAIVLVNSRSAEAELELFKMHPNLKTQSTTSYARRDQGAYESGKSRGASMHLGASMTSGGTKLLNG